MAKITPRNPNEKKTIVVKTDLTNKKILQGYKWWLAKDDQTLAQELITTAAYLKENQMYRYRQAGVFARLYGNMPLYNVAGTTFNKMSTSYNLPTDRPTMNVIQSCVDTLVSRVTQSRPRPVFLTDNADYKERNLSKQLNQFSAGEMYQVKAYQKGPLALRDASVLGTGCLKVYKDRDRRVAVDRVLQTELLVDPNDALYGEPRSLYQFKLVDREVLQDMYPEEKKIIGEAEQAYPDNGTDAAKTVADQVMIVEGWRLPSGKDTGDGKHVLACSSGIIDQEEWDKERFPFAFLHYSPRIVGFWGQPLAEQLMGTQLEINKLLMTISAAINLVGVPRVFVENGSKIVKAHLNNNVGSIVTYSGTKPIYEVAPCIPAEVYEQLQRLVQFAYQQSGVSAMSAAAQKPAGLNSGEAIRNFDDLQSDRFADLVKRYDQLYVDLNYLIIDEAREIAEKDGKYKTIYPNKNGTKEVNLPAAKLLEDTYIIQCFDSSSLPRDPAGRLQKITEMMQSGLIDLQEGRRLLDYPDLEQVEKLANSGEERILQILDEIVDKGKYTPPDPFMDLQLAIKLVTQYYNLYIPAKLEESKAQLLRDFHTGIMTLQQAAQPPAPQAPEAQPMAVPNAPPTSDMLPIVPQ